MQAYIGKIVQQYTADFPKSTCTAIFFAGCDFRCPYCFCNGMLDFKLEFLQELNEIKKNLESSRNSSDTLFLCGGEPLLQRSAILEICQSARENDYKVALETNGTKSDVLRMLIRRNLIDEIAMDIKAPLVKKQFEKVTRSSTFFKPTDEILENIRQSLAILKNSTVNITFRTTIVPGLLFRKEDLLLIAECIKDINCTWVLQAYMPLEGVNKKMSALDSPSPAFMDNLRETCMHHYPNLQIILR